MTRIAAHGPANKPIKLTVAFGARSLSAIRSTDMAIEIEAL
jgi:hypothetical protein